MPTSLNEVCEHDLKTWPEFFDEVIAGRKPFEVRRNDRGYRVGDVLHLREWSPSSQSYSGRSTRQVVTYLMSDRFGVDPAMVIMGIHPAEDDTADMAALGRAVMNAIETIQGEEGPFKDWTPAECPSEIILDMHEQLSQLSADLEKVQCELDAASQMVGEVEARFPNWRSYRDLIDCIDVTLHQLRNDAGSLRAGRAE